jgi:hypothetical protein
MIEKRETSTKILHIPINNKYNDLIIFEVLYPTHNS